MPLCWNIFRTNKILIDFPRFFDEMKFQYTSLMFQHFIISESHCNLVFLLVFKTHSLWRNLSVSFTDHPVVLAWWFSSLYLISLPCHRVYPPFTRGLTVLLLFNPHHKLYYLFRYFLNRSIYDFSIILKLNLHKMP